MIKNRNYEMISPVCRLTITSEDGEAFLVYVSKKVSFSIDLPCEIVEQLVKRVVETSGNLDTCPLPKEPTK
jgi:hypothetical protein